MSLCTTRGVGSYVAGEAHTGVCGRLYKPDATKRPIIYFTGGPGDDRDFLTSTASGSQIAPQLVESGITLISAAFGGAAQWGNDTAQTRIGQLWTFVQTLYGTKTDKFVGIGVSKGATALLNYTRNNPTKVAALLLIVPAVNVSDIYDNNRSSLATEINNAYGGSWTTAKATHDPSLNISTHASQAIPMKFCYGDADTTVLPSTVAAFASGVGGTTHIGNGLTHLTVAPALDPVEDVLKFLAPYI